MGWFISLILLIGYFAGGGNNIHSDYILIASGLFAIAGTIGWNSSDIGNRKRKD